MLDSRGEIFSFTSSWSGRMQELVGVETLWFRRLWFSTSELVSTTFWLRRQCRLGNLAVVVQDYASLKVDQLRKLLVACNLPIDGKKDELIKRLSSCAGAPRNGEAASAPRNGEVASALSNGVAEAESKPVRRFRSCATRVHTLTGFL